MRLVQHINAIAGAGRSQGSHPGRLRLVGHGDNTQAAHAIGDVGTVTHHLHGVHETWQRIRPADLSRTGRSGDVEDHEVTTCWVACWARFVTLLDDRVLGGERWAPFARFGRIAGDGFLVQVNAQAGACGQLEWISVAGVHKVRTCWPARTPRCSR